MKKLISLLLALAMVMSLGITAFATNEPVNSTGSIVGDIDKTLPEEMTGQDTNQGAASQYGEFGAGEQDVEVYVTKASTYTVTIPKVVVLSGASNTATGEYSVRVQGDIAGTEYIKVIPDATFALEQAGKIAITATVDQDKVKWSYSNLSIDGTGSIEATGLSAGSWNGSFKFNISRGEDQTTLEGDGQTFHKMAPSTLTFRSTAPIDEFQQVLINGEPLDEGAYTLTEGSTIVTLNIDYLETLDVDTYEITVVSDSGSPSADFGVVTTNLNEYGFYYNQPYVAFVEAYQDNIIFFFRKSGTVDIYLISNLYFEQATFTYSDKNIVVEATVGTFNATVSEDNNEIYFTELNTVFVLDNNVIVADDDYIYINCEFFGGYVEGFVVQSCISPNKYSYSPIKSNINGLPVIYLTDGLFENNNNLVCVPDIPENVFEIGNYVFINCTQISRIVIPSSMRNINTNAFKGCTNLNEIIFKGTVEQWNSIGFSFGWNDGVPATYVQCSDGQVSLI